MYSLVVLVLCGLLGANGQVVSDGQCDPQPQPMGLFDLESYLGLWYEIARTPNAFQGGDCATAQYTLNEGTGLVDVYNSHVLENFYDSINGTARLEDDTGRAALIVSFPSVGSEPTTSNYWVLNTDYLNYALVYNCENINAQQRSISVWKLGRTSSLTENMHIFLNVMINNIDGISSAEVIDTDHSEDACFLLPELEEGAPVVLGGQCDPNVSVVQNFDAQRYMGLWHDIASYQNEFQYGTCSNARYSLTEGGTVDILNTQVVAQALDTIIGTATADGAGTGRLVVTFPDGQGGTVQSEYLILATDYDNYALVYSCVNLNDDQMRVWSWKLGRSKQLSAASIAAIDDVTNNIIILNDRYYETTDQTDDGCFYLPDPIAGQPVVFPGQCQDVAAVANFDAGRYMGLWHDIETYPSVFQSGTCNNALYTLTLEGTVDVYNTQVVAERLDTIRGVARVVSDDNSGRLMVEFPVVGTDQFVEMEYVVLDTDYDNYALVYSCQNLNDDQRTVWSWKLSRAKQLSAAASAAIDSAVQAVPVLDQQYYEARDQTDGGCFYFPYAEPGLPVVFPGQCDEGVAAVANFDVAGYTGLWHEVSSYPSVFQAGSCNNALYTLADGGTVDVYNTQVLDGFLDMINGSAVLATDDQTGKLTVTFPIAGTTETTSTPYWITATDYDTYALVYSCVNLNAEQRAVWSWKLSRTKELPAAANAPIDAAIALVQVLDPQYYQERDQSDEGCFYLPELEPGEPVVIVGQCDANIAVVQNFDPTRYAGLWHEIESYPSDFQQGTCNNARYTLTADGSVEVYNTQVVDQLLDSVTGSAVLAGIDGSGKLVVTLPLPGSNETATMEYWILDTDYDNYALVYSCENIDSESRRVWSWKLSKTRQLTAAANAAMNAVIDTIPVLNNQYYQARDQSDDGCFYFPEPNGQPVFFRGQCDVTIPAVPNFDPERYTGRWYDIEKYPSVFQGGTCNTAIYTLTAQGTVDVYNTQVVGERLDAINGVAVLEDGITGKLLVTFPIEGTDLTVETSYWVLATDYDTYSLVYTCENISEDERAVWSWKLSRTKQLSAAANAAITAVVDTVPVIDARYFEPTDQTDEGCFYYPEPVAGVPVVFPGQCDPTVPVVQDFDAARYLGLWYEIEGYPSMFQDGECNNALYSLNAEGVVDVYNTQVLQERLDTINGTATADPAGQGVLTVTFPIAGTDQTTESPYWILATDYDTYSLVYSCVNINAEERAVWSWKLSRTKALSAAADAAMNSVIASVQVLDDQYYQQRDQSDEACFYLPYLQPGDPVTFVGQCDENIAVVLNFDPVRYQGLWHEIESYQSEFQDGTCNNAQYTLTPEGTVDVYNTQVVNQLLDTINGTAVPISNGKLLVSFPIAGTDMTATTEYWILDTDYDNYALVYTCVNLDAETRRVWSWKLSRSRQLSAASSSAIDTIVDTIPVLNEEYYNVRDQTDDACFYFPEPNGQPLIFRGQCDESIPAVPNFDPTRYTGLWYDIEKYPSVFQGGTCNNALYTLTAQGTVDVYNTQVVDERLDDINGVAVLVDGITGKLLVTFPIEGTDLTIETSYWVLATDYDTYSLVYTCENISEDERAVWSWKLSRTKQLSAAANTAISAVVDTVPVLDARYFEPTDQTDEGCFYYPEPVAGVPVVFPGQCDPNVPVVQDFDAARYLGLWYEIEGYPSMFQDGECNNALYSLNAEGIVDVYNTQVLQQRLDTINGTATADPAGQGVLTVTFPIAGTDQTTESPYWILATDYDTYSLVYSCVNINAEQRAVWSWKLSRTKELSSEANAAIDAVVASVQVLDDQYYQLRDQSDDACFYLPFLEPEDPVIFVGQCDLNIPAQPNFDPVRYMGLWHEIEAYPSVFQYGTCNNARYTLTAQGTVDVYNTQVVGERLDDVSGVAQLVADDGTGKLDVTFPVAGTDQSVTTNYWVLSTDYDNYALVYSCVNLDSERRQVWTWKLSRTRQLSDESQAAIDAVVATIPVLNDEYYAARDQTDQGCFYFPLHVPGQPVVFPGQCDVTVQVVQNFDPTLYTGLWYDVESYPQQFQAGASCANALYTLNEDGTVDVYNTQVLAQQLDTINGSARLDSDTAEGKLIVTFPIAGTDLFIDAPYWIISTDYENYSLVYACTNIAEDRRSVTSWKLSRQPTLSAASSAAIDAAAASVQVISDEYFETTGQSEEACFYYPDNNGGPVILDGQCEAPADVPVVENFNAAEYLGTWYEAARFPTEFQTGQCARALYSLNQNGAVDVTNTIVSDELLETEEGQAVASDDGRGVLDVTFPSTGPTSINYYVLDTDYQNFALVYSCRNVDDERKQVYSWKLSRSRQGLNAEANARIDAIVSARVDLFEGYYEPTDQGDAACFFYPEFADISSGIVLPGPCNQTIEAIPNFQADLYTGRWFEIARYPQEFEMGECARAEYTLTPAGTVDVVNTIVYEEALETVLGTAVAPGGNGFLIVTFPVAGTDQFREANYYVMDTDYVNFALVYSCRDLDSGDRQVSSWKLSRQPTLAPEFENRMVPTIEATQGLLQSYYLTTDQSDGACFYMPEPDATRAVVFRGQCEEVQGVANFDIERYLGWWHEIEHFPSGFDAGECLSSRYQVSGGQYISVNTTVEGLEATVTTNSLTVAADAPGRLRKTLDNGDVVDIWVLATDYETYSLLYSCQNIDSEHRQVWSAKHSKARELTAAAQAAMTPAIESNPVLDAVYYLPVQQTDDACFHYPALGAGQQVVMPGQCDDGIPVVTNFDAAAYTGLWFQIERYPQSWEFGTCSAARYTLDAAAGVVDVINSQVVDGELVAIEGIAVASEDERGVLTVTFPVEGTEETTSMELYVLATDYVTYALAYTCENVDQFQRSVGSWKLSRTRTLPAAAAAAIDAVVSSRPELHQPYFLDSQQSEECPDPSAGVTLRATALVALLAAILHLIV